MLRLLASGKTDRGMARKNNEDSFCVNETIGLFAVADGMGGHAAGDVASSMAMDVMRDYIGRNSPDGEAETAVGEYYKEGLSVVSNMVVAGVKMANKVIYDAAHGNESWQRMGTTVAVAVMGKKDTLSIGHVGDSRVYLVRAGSMIQLTDDHSVVSEQVREGIITKDEAERSSIRHIITRALGQNPEVEVDIKEVPVADEDRVVLCTDGLHSMLSDEAILQMVAASPDPEKGCHMLINAANENGGRDNIAVVIIHIYRSLWRVCMRKAQRWARR